MKIKAKCIKNLFVDPISVKKGEVVDVEVTTNYYVIVYHEILHTLIMLKGKQE